MALVNVLNFDDFDLETTGLSQSKFTQFLHCPLKFTLAMNRWIKPGSEKNFFFGTLAHEVMDFCYTNKEYDKEAVARMLIEFTKKMRDSGELDWCKDQELENYLGLTNTTMEAYFEYYADDFASLDFYKVEEVFKQHFHGILITGKIDARFMRKQKKRRSRKVALKKTMMEHKTKTMISEEGITNMLPHDFQNQYYHLAEFLETGEWADQTLYNVIRKAAIKQRNTETLENYLKRVKADIEKRPEFYFQRWNADYPKESLKTFAKDLHFDFQRMRRLVEGKDPITRNRQGCNANGFPCPYITACANDNFDGLVQKGCLNPELL